MKKKLVIKTNKKNKFQSALLNPLGWSTGNNFLFKGGLGSAYCHLCSKRVAYVQASQWPYIALYYFRLHYTLLNLQYIMPNIFSNVVRLINQTPRKTLKSHASYGLAGQQIPGIYCDSQ